MARELETALRKRESEPATPLTSSIRSFGLPYQPHTEGEETTSTASSVVEAAANKLQSSSNRALEVSSHASRYYGYMYCYYGNKVVINC